jgi:hypothetical protein
MNFDRLFALGTALGRYDFSVKFTRAEAPSDETYAWCAQLQHSHGHDKDYGPTPEAALEALQTGLTRMVETKRDLALATAKQFDNALRSSDAQGQGGHGTEG